MKSIQTILLLAALVAAPLPSRALTHVVELAPDTAVKIDARDADVAFPATNTTLKLVLNRSSDGESPDPDDQSRLLFTLPADLFSAPTQRLSRALLTLSSTYAKNYDSRPLFLHPLSAPFSPSNATWNARTADDSWSSPGGDFLTNSVSAVFDPDSATVAFDVAPLLADSASAAALRDNGAIVRFDDASAMAARFLQLTFASPAYPDDASLLPSLRCALADPFSDATDFALSYIDSRDADTVFWEQGLSTVGKIILNGQDGSECRAVLSMPESLAALDPALVQSVVLRFDAEIRDWDGESVLLAPIATATALERFPNNETTASHGPTWNCADAPVDTNDASFVSTLWTAPGGDALDAAVAARIDTTNARAVFDLTPLWRDPDARAALLANGALVRMDAAEWPSADRMPRVNLYRPDEVVQFYHSKYSFARITPFERLAADPESTALPAVFRIDSAQPDRSFFGETSAKLVLNFTDGSETRALCTLPGDAFDADLPAYDSSLLRFNGGARENGDQIPVLLSPAAQPFAASADDAATWNNASASSPWTSPGGDVSSFAVTGAYDSATGNLDFDLAPFHASPSDAADALANGLILRFDPGQTAVASGMPRLTIAASGQLVRTPKTLASTYIDSTSPDANFSAKSKTLVTLNNASSGGEARALLQFAPALFGLDLSSVGSVNLLVNYAKRWPGDSSVNPVALHPAAAPFRLDQATWNDASSGTPWATPGGDFLPACATASDDASAQTLSFDLAPLLADPESAAALAANGAVVRMLGDPPQTASNNGYNALGSTAADPAQAPVLVLVPPVLHLDSAAFDPDAAAFVLSVSGREPLAPYEVWATSDLSDPKSWQKVRDLPDSSSVALPASSSPLFYRIQPAGE